MSSAYHTDGICLYLYTCRYIYHVRVPVYYNDSHNIDSDSTRSSDHHNCSIYLIILIYNPLYSHVYQYTSNNPYHLYRYQCSYYLYNRRNNNMWLIKLFSFHSISLVCCVAAYIIYSLTASHEKGGGGHMKL